MAADHGAAAQASGLGEGNRGGLVLPKEVSDPSDAILLVKAAVDRAELGVCQALDRIEEELKKRNLLYLSRLPCSQVGIDQQNRAHVGGSFHDVHLLANDIVRLGFSWPKTDHATACEITPQDPAEETFNTELAAEWKTDDPDAARLAPVTPGSLLFTSLACGHTNAGFRCVAAKVPCQLEYISRDGFMDIAKIRARDPVYAEGVEGGLRWRVYKWEVRHMFPWLLSFASAARNTDQHVARPETTEQGLAQIHRLASTYSARNSPIDWKEVQEAVAKTNPPFVDDLGALVAFVSAKAGGKDGEFLAAYLGFCRMFVKSHMRRLPGALYLAVADYPQDLPSAYAVLIAAYTCPEEHVQHRMCNWITPANILALSRSQDPKVKSRLKEVSEGLSNVWANLKAAGCNTPPQRDNQLTEVLVKLQVNAGRYLLDRQGPSAVKSTSGAQLFFSFAQNFAKVFPTRNHSVFTGLFRDPGEAPQAQSPSTQQPSFGLYEVSAGGQVTEPLARLRAAGFDAGSCVTLAASDELVFYRVLGAFRAASEDFVCLAPWEGTSPSMPPGARATGDDRFQRWVSDKVASKQQQPSWYLPAAQFLTTCAAANPKEIIVRHPGWPAFHTAKTAAAQVLRARAAIITGLAAVSARVQATNVCTDGLELHVKPQRRAVTTREFAAHTLILAPDTLNLKVTDAKADGAGSDDEASEGTAGEAWVEPAEGLRDDAWLSPGSGGKRFWLAAATTDENVAPFWFVRPTSDPAQATLTLVKVWVRVSTEVIWPRFFQADPRPPPLAPPPAPGTGFADAKQPSEDAEFETALRSQAPALPALSAEAPAELEARVRLSEAKERAAKADAEDNSAAAAAEGRGPRTKEGKAAKQAATNKDYWAAAVARATEELAKVRAAASSAPACASGAGLAAPPPPAGPQEHAAAASEDDFGTGFEEEKEEEERNPYVTVLLQLFTNGHLLPPGSELIYYRAKTEKKTVRKATPITFQNFAKKAKLSKT